MIIAVNTRLLLKDRLEGIGWFTFETLKRITSAHKEHQFYFIFDRPYSKDFIFSENVRPVIIGPQARHPFLFYLWFEYSLPRMLRKVNADLFISPDGYCSLSTKVPSVAVMHDLNFEHYPNDLPWLVRKYYRYFFPRFARKAARIATVSEFSKNDICKTYNVPESLIDVVYNGAGAHFHPISESEKQRTKQKFAGGHDYFIFVGALHPRKNLKNLFLAYELFRKSSPQEVKLLIAGAKKWWTSEIERIYSNMHYRDDVIFAGRLSAHELNEAIGASSAMTYVSCFEGFGIPILEAFHCGVPVITSNITSMPEVAGDAALLIDPFSPASIADAMNRIVSENGLAAELIQKGNQRKTFFSWDKTAENLWKSIEKCLPSETNQS
ncbi:MAG: glycosyltransferase family 1 protein [Bacteroidota bacterium]